MFERITFFIALLLVMVSGITYGVPGDLDTTFNSPIGAVTYGGEADEVGWAVAIQSDGKIVVVGYTSISTCHNVLVLRYNADGSPDTGFGTNGVVIYDGGSIDAGMGVAIQSDGKIVVVGCSVKVGSGDYDVLVLRYNADGSPDNSFGTNGVITYDSGSLDDCGRAVAIQSDGKIVVAGEHSEFLTLVLRYNADGSLDTGFGTNGAVILPTGEIRVVRSVAIQSDGKIIVAGGYGGGVGVLILRFNADGSFDTGFGTNGVVTYDDRTYGLAAAALQSDGKIVVSSGSDSGSNPDVLVLRYHTDGTLDNGFGTNGVVTYNGGDEEHAVAIAIQADGKIVIAGISHIGSRDDILVLRYNADGSPDTGFGTNGVVTYTYEQGSIDWALAVAIQSDGKIVVVGGSDDVADFTVGRIFDVLVVRFIGDESGGLAGTPLGSGGSGGGCFIATAAYGSPMAREVEVLEKVRDEYMLTNELGRAFVSGYYKYSPPLADWIAKHPLMRKITRIGLYPILELSRWFVGENPSEQRSNKTG